MLRKTLQALSVSAILGAAVIASNAAFAFGPPPLPPMGLGGPPPMLGGHPPGLGLPHLGGAPPHLGSLAPHAGLGAGRPTGLSRLGGRAAGYGSGRSAGYGYGHSGSRCRHWGYGAGYGGYASDGDASYSYANDGCYSEYSRGRRVMVCGEAD